MLNQLLGFFVHAFGLLRQGGGEQPGGIERLHQVVADRCQEARFGLAHRFGLALGLRQRLVELGQFMGAFGYPLLQAFVGITQGLLGFAERGDVGEAHHKATTGHRVADQLDHPAVGEQPFGGVRTPLAHPVQAPRHMDLRFAWAAQAAFGVVANDVGDRPANADQAVGVVEQFQVAPVPGHQVQVLVDHADALVDVLDGTLQQGAVELQHLAGFIGDAHHVLKLHVPAFDGRLDDSAGRGAAEHASEQALGVLDPVAVGVLVGIEAFALAIGKADEALPCTLFTDKTRGEGQQVVDLHGQQRFAAGASAGLLADEAPGLPVFRHAGT